VTKIHFADVILLTTQQCHKCKVIIQEEEKAMEEAKRDREGLVFWTERR
jgi:hypothetical protein